MIDHPFSQSTRNSKTAQKGRFFDLEQVEQPRWLRVTSLSFRLNEYAKSCCIIIFSIIFFPLEFIKFYNEESSEQGGQDYVSLVLNLDLFLVRHISFSFLLWSNLYAVRLAKENRRLKIEVFFYLLSSRTAILGGDWSWRCLQHSLLFHHSTSSSQSTRGFAVYLITSDVIKHAVYRQRRTFNNSFSKGKNLALQNQLLKEYANRNWSRPWLNLSEKNSLIRFCLVVDVAREQKILNIELKKLLCKI